MKAAILTISDSCSRGERVDESGRAIEEILAGKGWEVVEKKVVPDEKGEIVEALKQLCDEGRVLRQGSRQAEVVLTTGGTGLGPRDVTPEATAEVCEKEAPGICEVMRAEGLRKTRTAMLSRGKAGIRKHTLIINLPGSVRGARESLEAIIDVIPHAVEMIRGGGH